MDGGSLVFIFLSEGGRFQFLFFVFVFVFFAYFGIAVLAPRASYSFATAQKSNQKRPPLQLRP